MNLSNRVARLEEQGNETPTVFGSVPLHLTREEGERALRQHALQNGVKPPFSVFAVGVGGLSAPRIDGIGPLQQLIAHVAKHGRRLGEIA